MYTSTAQCINGKIILHRHLKCDGNESHSIRMLKRHLLLNSQTHTTTTRTTLRMYQCITVSHCISVAKMPPSMTAQSCTHHCHRIVWHSPLSQDGGDPSGAGHGSVSGKDTKNIHLRSKFTYKSKLPLFLHPSSKSWLGKLCSFTLQSV